MIGQASHAGVRLLSFSRHRRTAENDRQCAKDHPGERLQGPNGQWWELHPPHPGCLRSVVPIADEKIDFGSLEPGDRDIKI